MGSVLHNELTDSFLTRIMVLTLCFSPRRFGAFFADFFFIERGRSTHICDASGPLGVSHPVHAAPCHAGAVLPRRARVARVLRRCSSADLFRAAAATPAWLGFGKNPQTRSCETKSFFCCAAERVMSHRRSSTHCLPDKVRVTSGTLRPVRHLSDDRLVPQSTRASRPPLSPLGISLS